MNKSSERIYQKYNKRWWLVSFTVSGFGGATAYLVHGSLQFPNNNWSLSFHSLLEIIAIVFLASLISTLTFFPAFYFTDKILYKSFRGTYLVIIPATVISSSIILRNRFEISHYFLETSWHVYLFFFIMGLIASYGWNKSKMI